MQDADVEKKKDRTDWKAEARSIFFLIVAVLAFHSFIAKPFYIPSESMMPRLLVGDRLVVSKYPYGWSYVSPSIHVLSPIKGRLLGRLPERGDILIVTPRGKRSEEDTSELLSLMRPSYAVFCLKTKRKKQIIK